MHTVNLIIRLVDHHQILAYGIVYVGLIFEGEFIIISTGILAHLGAMNFWLVLVFIILGALSKTVLGYSLGGFLFRKFNHNTFFTYVKKRVELVMPRFHQRPFWSIFISKFIMGANHIVILFSGFERINYRKYLEAEIASTLVWAPLLLSLGYFFSYTALHISREIWRFLIIVLILTICFILFDKLVSWLFGLFEEFYYGNKK